MSTSTQEVSPTPCSAPIPPLRPQMYRRYGRHDLRRFDHLAEDAASLGTFHRGKMRVDCRFLFSKTRWGTYESRPAGIIYLDLCFHEPKGYRLSSATVRVTLDGDSKELPSPRGARPMMFDQGPGSAVQMVPHFGPRHMVGQERTVRQTTGLKFSPQAHFPLGGVALGDVSRESEATVSCRWSFRGDMVTRDWKYEALEWELAENDLERHASHSNLVHTAFTFRHDRQPFFLKVDVDGRLRGLRRELRSKLSGFRASTKKGDAAAVTLVKFEHGHVFDRALDDHAHSLCAEMERENLREVAMEVPDPMPVTFQNATPPISPGAPATEESNSPGAGYYVSLGGVQAVRQYDQVLGRQQQQQMLGQEPSRLELVKASASPTEANLARMLHVDLTPREPEPPARAQSQDEECGSSTTYVENAAANLETTQDKAVTMSYLSAYLLLVQLLAVLRELRFRMASKLFGAPPTQVKALFDSATPSATVSGGGLGKESRNVES